MPHKLRIAYYDWPAHGFRLAAGKTKARLAIGLVGSLLPNRVDLNENMTGEAEEM
jgi:hypothetical protein